MRRRGQDQKVSPFDCPGKIVRKMDGTRQFDPGQEFFVLMFRVQDFRVVRKSAPDRDIQALFRQKDRERRAPGPVADDPDILNTFNHFIPRNNRVG